MSLSTLVSKVLWMSCASMFALAVSVPGAYGIGALLALLISMVLLFGFKGSWLNLDKDDKRLFWTFCAYGLGMFVFVYLDGWHIRELDRPARFLLALPILVALLRAVTGYEYLFYTAPIGGASAFSVAIYERVIIGLDRARGGEHPIMFGDVSMMLGLISCVSAMHFFYRKNTVWLCISLAGVLGGVGSSVLSGSRGGWVALPLIGIFLLWHARKLLNQRTLTLVAVVSLASLVITVSVPQTGVMSRIDKAIDDMERYQVGDLEESSVGLRFDMWKGAMILFQMSPVYGVGEYNGMMLKRQLAEEGVINAASATFSHSHNEYFDALALRGVLGFLLLLLVYLVPLRLFASKISEHSQNWNIKVYAMAGALVPMSYMDFALTQSMFSHDIGVMMFIFPIIFFWAAVKRAEQDLSLEGVPT